MTDAEQIAAWHQILAKAKKWGEKVPWQELAKAVEMLERYRDLGVLAPAAAGPGLGTWETDAVGVSHAEEEIPAISPTLRAGSYDDPPSIRTITVDRGLLLPANPISDSVPGLRALLLDGATPSDPQGPLTSPPTAAQKRADRAQAYNQFAKGLRAQGLKEADIGKAWRDQKAGG